ncbi:MAG: arginine repressor [Gaiellaceae bacterium]
MSRADRHGTILRLIKSESISTQHELAVALRDAGHDVVQTTVSRDVSELGLVKIRNADGRLVYASPDQANGSSERAMQELRGALRRWALSIESSANLVVITVPNGYAPPLAESIDSVEHPMVLGTLAGETTVLVVAREGVPGAQVRDELRGMTMGVAA